MNRIPKSGLYNTNIFGRIALLSFEEVLGKPGLNAILNLAGINDLIDNYPPGNWDREFDFADFSAILVAMEEIYGHRGGRGLALRAGRATFNDTLKNYGPLAGVTDIAFKILPTVLKLRIGLSAAARTFSRVSDQATTVEETPDSFLFNIHQCPSCWGRFGADKPVCFVTVGFLEMGMKHITGGHLFQIREVKCRAVGDDVCQFVIQKEPIS
ncbi:MAG TPA: 4-vinyl reductase [Anaerolineales bacterium]|nr:4-vinyl reductase [Anaerolineales bacterium]